MSEKYDFVLLDINNEQEFELAISQFKKMGYIVENFKYDSAHYNVLKVFIENKTVVKARFLAFVGNKYVRSNVKMFDKFSDFFSSINFNKSR